MTATTGPLTLSQHTATANVQHDTVASQIHKETQICCNWQDLRFCRTCHYRSAAVACGCLTFSPMTDARNPSCAVRPTNTSFFLLKPKLVMPRNFFGSETLILGFWLGPFCLFFTSFWLDSLKVGLPGRAACSCHMYQMPTSTSITQHAQGSCPLLLLKQLQRHHATTSVALQ